MTQTLYEKFTPPTLADLHGRTITYLRVSVTDRCNFVCTYCLPAEGVPGSPRATILTFEETERLVRAFAQLGVRSVRISGGEPTVRRDIVDLVGRVAAVDGIVDVAMTTNAFILDRLAAPLKQAGLTRLNVSLDTIVPGEFSELTRGEDLGKVLAGLEASRAAGFQGTKINAVVVRGVNDASAPGLVEWCWEQGFIPRFIELMPMGEGQRLVAAGRSVPNEELRSLLGDRIESEAHGRSSGQGPAVYYRRRTSNGSSAADAPHMVGFMSQMLGLAGDEKILEIGTGSGYQAAVLARITPWVYTIEIKEPLHVSAKGNLKRLGYRTVHARHGDGYYGWPEAAPFDAIIVTAAAPHVPPPLVKQLKNGGRMILPVGAPFAVQDLRLVRKDKEGRVRTRSLYAVRFVPLTGSLGKKAKRKKDKKDKKAKPD